MRWKGLSVAPCTSWLPAAVPCCWGARPYCMKVWGGEDEGAAGGGEDAQRASAGAAPAPSQMAAASATIAVVPGTSLSQSIRICPVTPITASLREVVAAAGPGCAAPVDGMVQLASSHPPGVPPPPAQ